VDLESVVTSVFIGTAVFCLVAYLLYRLVLWARRRAKGAYVLGAILAPFIAGGNVSDPDFRVVNEAKHGGKRREGDTGDPPTDE
jgi:hypothetical protein